MSLKLRETAVPIMDEDITITAKDIILQPFMTKVIEEHHHFKDSTVNSGGSPVQPDEA
jgi:hypothetical protein